MGWGTRRQAPGWAMAAAAVAAVGFVADRLPNPTFGGTAVARADRGGGGAGDGRFNRCHGANRPNNTNQAHFSPRPHHPSLSSRIFLTGWAF